MFLGRGRGGNCGIKLSAVGGHNLQFKLNRPNESEATFLARISNAAEQPEEPAIKGDDNWIFDRNRRDVGSLHIDRLICPAADLGRRNLIAVHPVAGWWKTKTVPNPENHAARFALIAEIDAGTADGELYAEVETAIANRYEGEKLASECQIQRSG